MSIAAALSVKELGRELGRSPSWVYKNWEELVIQKVIPAPIIETGGPVWSAAQVYAYLDRKLTPAQRAAAAAYRAALAAALATPKEVAELDEVEAARATLARRFAPADLSGTIYDSDQG